VLYGVELATDDDQLVDYIQRHPHEGTTALAKEYGVTRQAISEHLARLQRQGRVEDEDQRKTRNSWVVRNPCEPNANEG
jgi:predicted transcriptional regulator